MFGTEQGKQAPADNYLGVKCFTAVVSKNLCGLTDKVLLFTRKWVILYLLKMLLLAVCTILFIVCTVFTSQYVSKIQPEPYMDEIFHIPQVQQYCKFNFTHVSILNGSWHVRTQVSPYDLERRLTQEL